MHAFVGGYRTNNSTKIFTPEYNLKITDDLGMTNLLSEGDSTMVIDIFKKLIQGASPNSLSLNR